MRLFDLLYNQLKTHPIPDALCHKVKGEWKKYSTSDVVKYSQLLGQGLIERGVKPGDKIAIISEGRPEWVFVDIACQQIGAILVPLYPTLSSTEYQIILEEAEVTTLFISNAKTLKSVEPAAKSVGIRNSYTFSKIQGRTPWVDLLALGKGKHKEELISQMKAVQKDDLCTIIYTSGTSGRPKGVMLSHDNIISNIKESAKVNTLTKGQDRALSFLPFNHIFEKSGIFFYMYACVGVYFAESLEAISDNLKEVKPHTFNTVPRLLEKVYDKILKTGSELSIVKKSIFNLAIKVGLKYDPNVDHGGAYKRQHALVNKLVFEKWRDALGGNIKQIQCGASALQPRLAKIFWAAGIKVLEGYGLTETSPVIAANRVDNMRPGSVGVIYDNLEVKLGEEDEVLVKGPSVMKGYYKNEALTREVFTEDGFFKTGDVGSLDGKFLTITDRKKELFKTSGGLYIAPQQMENKLKESIYVDQVMVVGENEKFPAALIVPNVDELMTLVSGAFELIDASEIRKNPKVLKVFQEVIDKVNEDLGSWEKIKEFRLLNQQWTPETGELTPTMKLKRRVIKERYKMYIDSIYDDKSKFNFDEFEKMELENMTLEELERYEQMEMR